MKPDTRKIEAIRPTKPKSKVARWTATLKNLPALSVRQPFAWLIAGGFKDVENRGKRTHYRGPVLIHAGLNHRGYTLGAVIYFYEKHGIRIPDELLFGGVVGVVDIVDCVEKYDSKWFAGKGYGWVLANPRQLSFRPCKGALGMFRPKFEEL